MARFALPSGLSMKRTLLCADVTWNALGWVLLVVTACGTPQAVRPSQAPDTTQDVPDALAELPLPQDATEPDVPPEPDVPLDTGPQPWRSAMFPQDWTPQRTESDGRFLHDFSYAGYHHGEVPLPAWPTATVLDVLDFGADPTGTTDSTLVFQKALETPTSGPLVVHVPAGQFRLDGVLKITRGQVVLRGEGPAKSRLWFTRTQGMDFQAHLTFAAPATQGPDVLLAQDAPNRAMEVRVLDAGALKPGDEVSLGQVITPEFVADHGMTGVWKAFNGKWQPFLRRKIVSVDKTVTPPRVVLDAPLRDPALLRDQASLRVDQGLLTEVGVEHLGLSNAVPWLDAWARTQVHVLAMQGVADAWVLDVDTFASPDGPQEGPGLGSHLMSGGLLLDASRRITVADCHFGRAEHRGDGGNGYLFEVRTSADVLMRDCEAKDGRHGFIQNWGFGTTGWVLLRCHSLGGTNRLSRDLGVGLVARSEFHHSLATANLIDSCTFDDGFGAVNRGQESTGAGHTATQTVLWNVGGVGTVLSMQFGWGYVIGSRAETTVTTQLDHPSAVGTAPEDWREGIGLGQTLVPASLYEAQRARRLGK